MSRRSRESAPEALDVLEEAAHLLRRAPLAACAAYLAGTVPFLLGGLYFIADMSRGVHAGGRAAAGALVMTGLFAWMKAWQSVAAGRLLAMLEQRVVPPLRFRDFFRALFRQFRLQASGLIALPLAALVMVPLGWVYAYYQNLTVLDASEGDDAHAASVAQAKLWARQNHLLLSVVALVGLFVFVNVAATIYFVPSLLRSLLGVKDVLTTTGWNPLNTTFLAVAAALTFLAMDPWLKAAYVLRCFYGKARHDGVDLLVQVRAGAARAFIGAATVVLFALVWCVPGRAAEASAGAPAVERSETPAAVTAAELDQALDQVLRQTEYSWRLPRETVIAEDDDSWIAQLMRTIGKGFRSFTRWMSELVERFVEWLLGADAPPEGSLVGGSAAAPAFLRVLLVVLAAALLGALLWLAWRWWSGSRAPAVIAPAATVVPVLESDAVTADQLPEDEWLRLARELRARGDVRLALRAWFLATLAGLAGREVLVLARHKSNRDYEREFMRRGTTGGELAQAFTENRRLLEQVWYGRYAAADDEVQRYEHNVRQLLGGRA